MKRKTALVTIIFAFLTLLTSCQEKHGEIENNFSQFLKTSLCNQKTECIVLASSKGKIMPVHVEWNNALNPSKEDLYNIQQCVSKRKYITVDIPLMLTGQKEGIMMGSMTGRGSVSFYYPSRIELDNFTCCLHKRGFMQITGENEIFYDSYDVESAFGIPDDRKIFLELKLKKKTDKIKEKKRIFLYIDGERICQLDIRKTNNKKNKIEAPVLTDNSLYMSFSKNNADDIQKCAILYSGPLLYPLETEGPRTTKKEDL